MASKQIKISELDFNQIKENIKLFFKGQDEFQDYNYEGSALSVLIDVLAYNTHYNVLYQNMTINEVFLDSAVKRDSVVSIAKSLGYTPRSSIAPKSVVNLLVTNLSTGAPDVYSLERGATFTTVVDNKTYTYVTSKSNTAQKLSGQYLFENVELLQGDSLTNKITVAGQATRFIIPNVGCDLTTLRVSVQENASSSDYTVYNNVENIVSVKTDSNVYYVKEIEGGLYEVYFGQNILGKSPEVGNVVILSYVVTNGPESNGASNFTYTGNSIANGIASVTTISSAVSGKEVESIESIRINASNTFASQNRAVNPTDYETIIYNQVPNISSISVWGGEDNIPPVYGKTFISIKPVGRDSISKLEANSISTLLKGKRVSGITPEFVNPSVYKLLISTVITYNPELTSLPLESLKLKVLQTIDQYNIENLNKFEGNFRHSQLSTLIDSTDSSFVSNITTADLSYAYLAPVDTNIKDTIRVNNEVKSVSSTQFIVTGYANRVKISSVGNTLFLLDVTTLQPIKECGAISGSNIILNNFRISSLESPNIVLNIGMKNLDVVAAFNQIIVIDLPNANINMVAV